MTFQVVRATGSCIKLFTRVRLDYPVTCTPLLCEKTTKKTFKKNHHILCMRMVFPEYAFLNSPSNGSVDEKANHTDSLCTGTRHSFTCVTSHVRFHLTGLFESSNAFCTTEWLFPSVNEAS